MEKGHGSQITHKQERVIAALLSAPSQAEAAEQAKVSQSTIERWLRDNNGFKKAYGDARRRLVEQAIGRLQQATNEAVDTLRKVMADVKAPATSRVSAAKAVLDTSLKTMELQELETRMLALERRLEEMTRQKQGMLN